MGRLGGAGRGARWVVVLVTASLATGAVAAPGRAQQSEPENVRVSPEAGSGYQQPSLAADPARPGRLAVAHQNGFDLGRCFLSLSADRGRTWAPMALAGRNARFPLPQGAFCWNPMLAFGPDGTLYYVFQTGFYFNQGDRRVYIAVSRDGGDTFVAPRPVSALTVANEFWPAVAVDQRDGRVYVSWTAGSFPPNSAGMVMVASSADAGTTFSLPVPANPAHVLSLGSVVAVGPEGRLYVSYIDQGLMPLSNSPTLETAVSSDGGRTFLGRRLTTTVGGCLGTGGGFDRLHSDGPCRLHTVAAGPGPGAVLQAWWDERGEKSLARISVTSSRDGGLTWSTARIVGIPAGAELDHQHRPALAVAPAGRYDMAFYNRQGAAQDGPQDVYWSSSTDGGAEWSVPEKLNDVPSDSKVGPTGRVPAGFPSWGDFLGVASADSEVYAAWTDSRRGTPETGIQDIYFARRELGVAYTSTAAPAPAPVNQAAAPPPASRQPALPATGGPGGGYVLWWVAAALVGRTVRRWSRR